MGKVPVIVHLRARPGMITTVVMTCNIPGAVGHFRDIA